MPTVAVEVDPSLRFLLRPVRRGQAVVVDGAPTDTLGHLVQAVGVPLTEVGGLLLDGAPVGPGTRLADVAAPAGVDGRAGVGGATLRVAPVPRPQATPTDPPRFLLDVHLGRLARHLRLLGLDAAWSPDPAQARDADLARRSAEERRVLLTRDRLLLHRRAVTAGALVRGALVGDQLADVLDRFAPTLAPWTRCMACGGTLQPVAVDDVAAGLRAGTRRSYRDFSRCTACRRVFWHGAHARRLEGVVSAARAIVDARRGPTPSAGPGPARA